MTRKASGKSTKVTKKDIFETALAIRLVFGEQPDEFKLEQTKTSVRMIVFTQESAEEALPHIQQTLNEQKCKAPVEILVRLKTLKAQEEGQPEEKPAAPETPAENKLSEGLRAYLNQAAIPFDKGIDVSLHLKEEMSDIEVSKKLLALFGEHGARVIDARHDATKSRLVRVKAGLIRRFNEADWVIKVNRYYGEAQAYSANVAQ
ncbi:MAG: hypothetical protein K2Y22_06115 [Candidatus Obscuribacterales bacterium]|nr:hypothetical protein [Candidatus Obscuribacterales bacterium]